MPGLLENLRLAADESERLERSTAGIVRNLDDLSQFEPDLPTGLGGAGGGGLGAAFAAASVRTVPAGGGSNFTGGGTTGGGSDFTGSASTRGGGSDLTGGALTGGGKDFTGESGGGGGGGSRISMGGGGGGGNSILANPTVNAFIKSQVQGGESALAAAISDPIVRSIGELAKVLRGDGGASFRVGGGLG